MIIAIIIIGTLALIGGLVWLSLYIEKKRTEAVRQSALRLGFNFFPKGDPAFFNEMGVFHLFQQGHTRLLKNLMRGAGSDPEVAVFDYRYTIGSGKNQQTKNQTVIWFRSSGLNLPAFTLSPENIMHKIGALLGYQDIDFEQNPGFSKRYLLRGQDETRIRMLFNNSLLRFFEQKHPVSAEGRDNHFIFYRSKKQVKPETLNSFVEEGRAVLNVLRSGR
jgi:hypothetical protein